MAKSDCGLPANSHATKMCISREQYDLQWALAEKQITLEEYKRRSKQLKNKTRRKR